VENFILTLSLLIIGMLLKQTKIFPASTSESLNLFVIYVSLPALVLLKVPELQFSFDLLAPVIVPWFLLLFSAALLVLFGKRFNWSREVMGALLLIVPLGNTSFLGIPMVQAFFGDEAVPYALMYDQLGSFLALAVYGSLILAIYSPDDHQLSIQRVLFKVVTFPPFISLVAALVLTVFSLPQAYFNLLSPLASTLIPVVMIAVGFQLHLKLRPDQLSPFLIGLSIKMIVAPFIILLVFLSLGLQSFIYKVTVFEAAMPPMVSAGALAIIAKLSPRLTAAMIAYGIILSFVTLPIWSWILNH
jgi:predicted permease